jgi:transcription elongation factor GreA
VDNKYELTREKLFELQSELRQLIEVGKPQVIKELSAARDQGDLSENADYDAAKNKQSEIENRIAEIETILNNYTLIEKPTSSKNVRIGSTVEVERDINGKTSTKVYTIVGAVDADPATNKISNDSPIALAIMGKAIGDSVKITNVEKPYQITIKKIN